MKMQGCWFWLLVIFAIAILLLLLWLFSRPANGRRLAATLSGSQEVPAVTTAATGSGNVFLSSNQQSVDYSFTVNNLTTPATAAHFHRGVAGQNGPVVKDLNLESLGNNSYRLRGRWTRQDATQPLTNDLINDLLNGRLYVNVHTNQYPNGEVRGQVNVA